MFPSYHLSRSRYARLHEPESGNTIPAFSSLPEDEEEPAPSHRLDDLLKRRYFSRIWIIRELLLSQRIVMRVGDVDFWADAAMATHFSADVPEWNWERTDAAWVKHIAQGMRDHINPDYQPVMDSKYVYILILNSWDNVCDNYSTNYEKERIDRIFSTGDLRLCIRANCNRSHV